MKKGIQIALWLLSIFFGYMIYQSINAPIKFDKIKTERYTQVINKLKDIRDAQEAHRSVTGVYANDFNSLIQFIDTAEYTLLEKRDSSFLRYNKTYRIDMPVDTVVVDTLGFVKVKDSLFKDSDRYKTLMNVPFAANNETFTMKAGVLDKNGYKAPVFEAKVAKNVILHDQPKDLVTQENDVISVDGVNGSEIIVGSLEDVSINGNWPTIYDTKAKKNN
jgi:hypothetical protein